MIDRVEPVFLFTFSFQRASCLGIYILWSPKWDGPATRRSGASVIVDARLQRFLLVTQAF